MRGRRNDNPAVRLSKSLSWLLRHGAEKEGFQLLPGGYLYIDDILQKQQFSRNTLEEVKEVVASNEKQRFHLETDSETGRLKIRANQGHSLQVEDLQLDPITSADDYPEVIHGTYFKFWEAIRKQGLKRMTRTHVHFAAGQPGQSGVISGMRGNCDLIIHLNLEKALEGGLKFYRSANSVILTEGNSDGTVPPDLFSKVINRKTGAEIKLSDASSDTALCSSESGTQETVGASVSAEQLADEMDSRRKKGKKHKNKNVDI